MPHVGDRLQIEDCWAERAVEGNPIRQLLVLQGDITVSEFDGRRWAEGVDGRWPILAINEHYEGWELSLRAPAGGDGEQTATWLGGRTFRTPDEVTASIQGTLAFTLEEPASGRTGLRRPQLGALHSVLGYWTTGRTDPATVVMPTGTGKTETMLALLAAATIGRLLVVVPSDALRSQLAAKFETLGVLQRFGLMPSSSLRPVVGQVHHRFSTPEMTRDFAHSCNVIVTTPHSLNVASSEVRTALVDGCTHLFVDEAHHVPAATWNQIRDMFSPKPIVQFTATPFREDGRPVTGRQVYAFPLREAQADGYFAPINYVSIIDFVEPDRAVADRAVKQLRDDLAAGLDHVLMARVARKGRADDLLPIYAALAPEFAPVLLYSSLPARDRRSAIEALRTRATRIVICVDMLGEGFDLPALKVAAVHDPHKSLGVTLQFVGRFARAGDADLGDATVVVARPDRRFDANLRRLYADDADWNVIIRDLSETAIEGQQEVSDFEAAFGTQPDEVTLRNLEPKMSTVVFRTRCKDWSPEAAVDVFPPERLLTHPIAVNQRDRVAWFVTHEVTPVRWGDLRTVEEVRYHLYVLYWDAGRQLLYINSSNNDSVHQTLADAVTSATADRIVGESVYRVMAQLDRLVPTNVGVLDVRNRSRRFSLHVGADVAEGFPQAEAQTKTKTNIFAVGYSAGERVAVGAALKGRVWTQRAARSLHEWARWCDEVGTKLSDEGISVDEVMRGFIRPQVVDQRPPFVPLALEWSWHLYALVTEDLRLSSGGRTWPLTDSDLRIVDHSDNGPIRFEIVTPHWCAPYSMRFQGGEVSHEPGNGEVLVTNRRDSVTLTDFLSRHGLTVSFADDVTMVPPGLLLRPDRAIPPFDAALLSALDWASDGVDIRKESQGADRDPSSIQARAIRRLVEAGVWDVIVDDDGSGEIADVVALRVDGDDLVISLTHCKFSSESTPGARVEDLYELCGQAQKSAKWKRDTGLFFDHLIRRERRRQERGARSGLELGTPATLYDMEDRSRLLRTRLEIVLVQPGVSRGRVSDAQLELLACTELYVHETANARIEVLTSE